MSGIQTSHDNTNTQLYTCTFSVYFPSVPFQDAQWAIAHSPQDSLHTQTVVGSSTVDVSKMDRTSVTVAELKLFARSEDTI